MYKLLARLLGWTAGREHIPPDVEKVFDRCVVVAAPHTSNWDAFFMLLATKSMKQPIRFIIKKEWLKTPLGWLLSALGAIGIDRTPKTEGAPRPSVTQAMIQLFKENEKLTLAIAPEGTRQYRPKWKTGFYQVAVEAGVPLVLARLDYKLKIANVDKVIYPTGNMEADFREIMAHFAEVTPRHPERFCLDVTRSEVPEQKAPQTETVAEDDSEQSLELRSESSS